MVGEGAGGEDAGVHVNDISWFYVRMAMISGGMVVYLSYFLLRIIRARLDVIQIQLMPLG